MLGKAGGSIPSVFGAGIRLAMAETKDVGHTVGASGEAVKFPRSWKQYGRPVTSYGLQWYLQPLTVSLVALMKLPSYNWSHGL